MQHGFLDIETFVIAAGLTDEAAECEIPIADVLPHCRHCLTGEADPFVEV